MKAKLPSPSWVRRLVESALKEDLGDLGDVTSQATIPLNSVSRARMISKGKGVLCGIPIAIAAFRKIDPRIKIKSQRFDGNFIDPKDVVLEVEGKTRSILAAERVALNLVQRLSGIATLTHLFVQKARSQNKHVQILDTRKTTPLLRPLEKYAVICGGGTNHRFGLYDMVLIKDNHLAALADQAHPILEAVTRARKKWPRLKVEVECDTLQQVREAVEAKADFILLDNMKLTQLRQAVRIIAGRAKSEASGGVNLRTIAAIARAGVDFISIGALTHSAPSLDLSLELADR